MPACVEVPPVSAALEPPAALVGVELALVELRLVPAASAGACLSFGLPAGESAAVGLVDEAGGSAGGLAAAASGVVPAAPEVAEAGAAAEVPSVEGPAVELFG
ncbi:MAG: hypothetical protein QOH03_2039 [Kribbellaceae bacterium]|nr:hypothetical protein [Kribbellaceae bacterium]